MTNAIGDIARCVTLRFDPQCQLAFRLRPSPSCLLRWPAAIHFFPFIASDVAGIRELVAPEDRARVLFDPTRDALVGALRLALANGDAFADVRSAFSGHELCDWGAWLHSVTWPIGNSYHPTAAGHQDGYLPVFSAAASKAGQ